MISAKILLFGEHIVIKGAQALVVPFPHFSGTWKWCADVKKAKSLQFNLRDFALFLKNLDGLNFDTDKFEQDLEKGLYFSSDIPTGYGLGSSGALTAAVFRRYCTDYRKIKEQGDLSFLKQVLGKIESFFHGTSSGTDPLICEVGQALWLKGKNELLSVETKPLQGADLFLLDTGVSRSTGPFVNKFLSKWEDEKYASFLRERLFPFNNSAITQFIEGKGESLYESFAEISRIQYSHFREMILPQHADLWQEGLKQDLFKLKICGAGGGGFMLGISQDIKKTQEVLKDYKLLLI